MGDFQLHLHVYSAELRAKVAEDARHLDFVNLVVLLAVTTMVSHFQGHDVIVSGAVQRMLNSRSPLQKYCKTLTAVDAVSFVTDTSEPQRPHISASSRSEQLKSRS